MTPLDLLNEVHGQWTGYQFAPATLSGDEVDLTHLESALAASTLNDRQRQALHLRYFVDCTLQQIARKLGISTERARQIVCTSVRKLRLPYNLNHIRRAVPGTFNQHRL